jgi:hypothetical protein
MTLRFSDLNPLGRAIIIVVAALTFGVAAVSFATSYGALYAWVRDTGLYSDRLTPPVAPPVGRRVHRRPARRHPGRHSARQPRLAHPDHAADRRPDRLVQPPARRQRPRPPADCGLAAGANDAGLRDRHPDRQVGHASARQAPRAHHSPPPDGMLPSSVPGAIWRPDGQGWNVPQVGAPTGWPQGFYGGVPAGHHLPENPQNSQTGLPGGAGGDGAGMTKRQRIEDYLDWLGPEELQNLTVRELTTELAGQGLALTERYVKQVLDQHRPPPQPQRRRRGSGARKPRR